MSTRFSRLGEALIDRDLFSRQEMQQFEGGDRELLEWLWSHETIDDGALARVLADMFGLPYLPHDRLAADRVLLDSLGMNALRQLNAIPLQDDKDFITVAIDNPYDLDLSDRLERLGHKPVRLAIAGRQAIKAVLDGYHHENDPFADLPLDFKKSNSKSTVEESVETASDIESAPAVKLVDMLLRGAMKRRASDIHIEHRGSAISLRYRIDGVLYPATELLDESVHASLVSRLKVMAELDISEKRVPQDGRFNLSMAGRDIDFRISILPSLNGEDVVIRILDKSSIAMNFEQLTLRSIGFSPEVLKVLRRAIAEPYGMVLITGPTGSGKTTTLYAALSETNREEEKIVTIEDPVEYQLDNVVQVPVNEKKQLTFARGLRSILRHDPDKIMVGEIRDADTAQIAVQSALTGHLVFTTVHANNVFDVVGRFSHMGIELFSLISALNCIISQRLIRLNCPHCSSPTQLPDEMLELSGLEPGKHADVVWYSGKGCEQCGGTGYRGRTAIAEMLVMTPELRELFAAQRPHHELMMAARAQGMQTLRQAALRKALDGETTLKEINRVTFAE